MSVNLPPPLPVSPNRKLFVLPFKETTLDRYLREVADRHGNIHFVGLPILKDTGRVVPLPKLFVEPGLSFFQIAPEDIEKEKNKESIFSLQQALIENPRLIILGDPGSGKSTIINWVCQKLSRFPGSDLTDSIGNLIPVPLVLRELALPERVTWDSLITAFLERPVAEAFADSPEKLNRALNRGQAFILVDGLDEVSVQKRLEIRSAIWEGWARFRTCRWLMTSRVVGYELSPFDHFENAWDSDPALLNLTQSAEKEGEAWRRAYSEADGGKYVCGLSSDIVSNKFVSAVAPDSEWKGRIKLAPRLYLTPFTNIQVSEFVNNWHTLRSANQKEATENAGDLLRAIGEDKGTKVLARVPNLLMLMALIHRQHATLPNGRALLFSKITEAYLESIDESRKLRAIVESSRSERERWLSDVAFSMQVGREEASHKNDRQNLPGEIRVSEEWLLHNLSSFLHERKKVSLATAEQEARALLGVIAERSGLLLPRGPDLDGEMWAFSHLSFQEYFAAQRLRRAIRSPGWSQASGKTSIEGIREFAKRESWIETFILLFESLAEDEVDEVSWPDCLAEKLFGPFEALSEQLLSKCSRKFDHGPIMQLAAALVCDPHSGLSRTVRKDISDILWVSYFEASFSEEGGGINFAKVQVAPRLLRNIEFHAEIHESLEYVVRTLSPKHVWLLHPECEILTPMLSIKNLESIILIGCYLNQEATELIGRQLALKDLYFEINDDVDISCLKKVVKLEELSISGTVKDEQIEGWFPLLTELGSLSLPSASERTVEIMIKRMRQLKTLRLGEISNECIRLIAKIKTLSKLQISSVDDSTELSPLLELPFLKHLEFWRSRTSQGPDISMFAGKKDFVIEVGHSKIWRTDQELTDDLF